MVTQSMSNTMRMRIQAGEPVIILDPLPDRRLVHQVSEIVCARSQPYAVHLNVALDRYLDAAVGRQGSGKSYRTAHELTCVPALCAMTQDCSEGETGRSC